MGIEIIEQRALAVLKALGVAPATKAASGRYQRSEEILPGVRYWSSSSDRGGSDTLGVQFFGPGLRLCERLEPAFLRAGFEPRNQQTRQVTFCKQVDRLDSSKVDAAGLRAVRAEIDALLGLAEGAPARSFVAFMKSSPLKGVDLEFSPRTRGERRDEI